MFKRLAHLLQDRQLSLFDAEAVEPVVADVPAARTAPDALANPRAGRIVRLGEHRVAYELKRARRRSIGFVVSAQGLHVSAPRWLPQADIERPLQQTSHSIL